MASESGVSTGGEDEEVPGIDHMAESDVPIVQEDDMIPKEVHVTESDNHLTLMERESLVTNSCLASSESCMAGSSAHVQIKGHDTRKGHVTKNNGHVILDESHVTNRNSSHLKDRGQMVKNDSHVIDDSDGGSSTATTDAFIEPIEPIDFIETRPHRHAPYFSGAISVGAGRNVLRTSPGIQYETVLAELTENSKKGI